MADTPEAAAFDIEKPACFYLGREYDLAKKAVLPDSHVMYDARDLTTHGVVVGMTGSGKTGLCISLLEEAAIDGIPSIIIDPKGDLTNLLLQFPDLDPKMFREWLNPEDARPEGTVAGRTTPSNCPNAGARGWPTRGQTPDRIRRLHASRRVAHLHAGQRGGPAAVDPRLLRRAEDARCRARR